MVNESERIVNNLLSGEKKINTLWFVGFADFHGVNVEYRKSPSYRYQRNK